MTPIQRTRVAAYAFISDERGRVLLCRISPTVAPGEVWTLPGGGIEFGKSPIDAVVREVAEETGLDGEVERLLDVSDRLFTDVQAGGDMHAIRIVYRVRITAGGLRDEVDGSTDTCAWFAIEDAERLNLGDMARRTIALAGTRSA